MRFVIEGRTMALDIALGGMLLLTVVALVSFHHSDRLLDLIFRSSGSSGRSSRSLDERTPITGGADRSSTDRSVGIKAH